MTTLKVLRTTFMRALERRIRLIGALGGGPRRRAGAIAEPLEQRAMVTAVFWDGEANDLLWSSAKNWSNDVVPAANDDITISGGATVHVTSPITINATLTLGGDSHGSVGFKGTQTLSGTGVIKSQDGALFAFGTAETPAVLTVGSGLTVEVSTSFKYFRIQYDDAIINHAKITLAAGADFQATDMQNLGTISAPEGGGVTLSGDSSNSGTVTVKNGTLKLEHAWGNPGTINVTNTYVSIHDEFSASQLGNFNRTGGTVAILGTLDNSEKTLSLNATTGSWTLAGGTIQGGTIAGSGGAKLITTHDGGLLVGVTISGDSLDMSAGTAKVFFFLTLNGNLTLGSAGNYGDLSVYGSTGIINGTGKVSFGSDHAKNSLASIGDGFFNTGRLVIDTGITIEAPASTSGFIGGKTPVDLVTNKGTISINAGTLAMLDVFNAGKISVGTGGQLKMSGDWSNTGTISATGGKYTTGAGTWSNAGTMAFTTTPVNLGGTFTLEPGSSFTQSGAGVGLLGTLNNTGRTLALNSTTGSWEMYAGKIVGGTVTAADGARLMLSAGQQATLDGVTLEGFAMEVAWGNLFVFHGLTVNGTLAIGDISDNYGNLIFIDSQSLLGTGTVKFVGMSEFNQLMLVRNITSDPAATLTIGEGVTITAPVGAYGIVGNSDTGDIVLNKGTISADGGVIDARGPFINEGVLEAFNDGVFTVNGVDVPTLTLSPYPLVVYTGQWETVSWFMEPISGTPTGNTKLYDGETLLMTGGAQYDKLSTKALSVGAHVLQARYSGDGTFINNRSHKVTVHVVNPLEVVSTEEISSPRTAVVGSLDVTFSEAIDVNSFDWESVTLTKDGGPNLIGPGTGVTLTLVSGTTYRIGGISGLTALAGVYSLSLVEGGVSTGLGVALEAGTQRTWTMQASVKNLSLYPAPRTIPVTTPAVRLSQPASPGTFTWQDITLTRNGGPNLATSGISITVSPTDSSLYTITIPVSLVSAVGTYTLTVIGAGIQTETNLQAYAGSGSTTWSILATAPSAPMLEPASEGQPGSGYTQFTTPLVKGTGTIGSTIEVYEGATLLGTGIVGSDGKYSVGLTTLSVGAHVLKARATDGIGPATGYSGNTTIVVETAVPTLVSVSSFPSPRTTPVLSVAVRLSSLVDIGTFDWNDLVLTRNAGANIVSSAITAAISTYDPYVVTITLPGSLVNPVGSYSLTINGAGIKNLAGKAHSNSKAATWSIIAGVPSAPVLDAGSEGKPGSGYTQYPTPVVKGTGSVGSTVEVYEGATLRGTGVVGSDGKYLVALTTLASGAHVLKARATDGVSPPTGYSAESTIIVETATPTISSMSVYPAPRTVPVGSTGIRFSSVIDLTTFTAADLVYTRNGVPVSTAGITVAVSPTDNKLYTISIPQASNTPDGVYVLQVVGSGIKNLAGKTVGNNMSTTWTVLPQILSMSQYPSARTVPVTSPGIRFSNPITLSTFTWADITLKRNGGANLATSGITIVASGWDPNVYTINIPGALTSAPGTYVLTVTGSGVQSPNGYMVSNTMSTTWTQL